MENSTLVLALMTVSEPPSTGYWGHLAEYESLIVRQAQMEKCTGGHWPGLHLRNPQPAMYREKTRGPETWIAYLVEGFWRPSNLMSKITASQYHKLHLSNTAVQLQQMPC